MNDVRPLCGRPTHATVITKKGIILNIACAVLVLALAVLLYHVADPWLERRIGDLSNNFIWREPLQSWN